MVAFARIFGANEDRANCEMREALEFEIKLTKVNKCSNFRFCLCIDSLCVFRINLNQ